MAIIWIVIEIDGRNTISQKVKNSDRDQFTWKIFYKIGTKLL